MSVEVKGKALIQIPIDTDSLNADSLKAALVCAIEMFEHDCERKLIGPDWSGIELAIHHDNKQVGTSLIVLRSPIL